MDYRGGGGGKYVSLCKACSKLRGLLGHAPLGNLDFRPFIRCNLGLFSHKIAIESPQKLSIMIKKQ